MPSAAIDLTRTLSPSLRQIPGERELLAFAQRNKPVVSKEQIDQYHADGYMVFDPLLPDAILDRAIADDIEDDAVDVGEQHHAARAGEDVVHPAEYVRSRRQKVGVPVPQ